MSILERFRQQSPRNTPGVLRSLFRLPDVQNNVRDSGTIFTFGQADSGEQVDEKSAMQISAVYACVRLLAESVAQLPLHFYRYTDNGAGKERVTDHPLYKLLFQMPNLEMTSFTWRETMMTHLLLWGNSYNQIIRDGKNGILALYPLLPENIEVDRDEHGEIYYIYSAYTDEAPGETNKEIHFRRDEILHIPGLGFNGLVGFSPIAMMKNTLGTTLAVEKYGSVFFKNGAQPSGVLEHPGVLKDPDKIRRNWTAVYGGANNAHKVCVLEEGMVYKPISLPPEDSQFLSTRQFGVEEICRMFNVPPHMVQDLQRSTFNNIESQSLQFVKHSVMPWLIKIEQGIIKDLLTEDEQMGYFPKFNVDGLLRGDYKSRMEGYAIGINNGIFSVNDVRKMENLDPLEEADGGDYHVISAAFTKLADVGTSVGKNQYAEDEKAAAEESKTTEEQNTGEDNDGQQGENADEPEQTEEPKKTRRRNARKASRR